MTPRDRLREIEQELIEEREAIQWEACEEEEIMELKARKAKGVPQGPRYLVPRKAVSQRCGDCGKQIAWRSVHGIRTPLDLESAEEDMDGTLLAVSHWRVCK